jgi:hypothetical protein
MPIEGLKEYHEHRKKEVDNISFTISFYIVLTMKDFPRDEFNHNDLY